MNAEVELLLMDEGGLYEDYGHEEHSDEEMLGDQEEQGEDELAEEEEVPDMDDLAEQLAG